MPLLSVENLTIRIGNNPLTQPVVNDLSFTLSEQETLCIAGESGSGKSLTSLAIMRLLPQVAQVSSGKILFGEKDLLLQSEAQMQRLRGHEIAMIFQDPMMSLNPIMTAGQQIVEAIQAHRKVSAAQARKEAIALLDAVKVPRAEKRFSQYPHEMSGGMLQRIMIAIALVGQPKILIADEPTTALDVTIQAQILSLLNELKADFNAGVIMITHDMGVVAEMANQVVVMNRGNVEEYSDVETLFTSPQAAYTQKLLAAVPKLGNAPTMTAIEKPDPLLEVDNLSVHFDLDAPFWARERYQVRAVDGVSFSLARGETLGIVGESGCGKSTTGKALMNMVPFSGSAMLNGTELNGLKGDAFMAVRKDIQMIFQDPYSSLNPRKSIFQLLREPLLIHNICSKHEVRDHAAALMAQVELSPDMLDRYPHQFSGGQRQRIGIARAIASQPKLVIADESVSALDVSVQAQVLELLGRLQQELQLSFLFISHDMAVIEQVSHRVAVMYSGRIVEMGPRDEVLHAPQHTYTQRLMQAVPIADVRVKRDLSLVLSQHQIPDPIHPVSSEVQPPEYRHVSQHHIVAI
ncbi:ABC transporter ATP-binding protein (plasmid) [Photobacterium sp. GJ3]|uniref:ABC transporter ATP-binding protein n=1 Tax=Photobacterium sp. GJ3 TaxID=2829502 RepID=UPI001B8B2E44|nr:ABC transporter ATP-binding protein [Photobacterium sp. GJ3]QUJ69681.1 ABC transporter ATP-binding protein [Photobacterium sp. GJ3]